VWGPKAWAWLHREAVDYPDAPSDRDRLAASIRFWSFVQSLPCENCRFHVTKYARRSPPDFRSSAHYQAWAWRIHNLVNRRLRKPLMTPEEYSETYAPVVEASYWRHV
jgi:FAD-linked sulfhydryl oxidase